MPEKTMPMNKPHLEFTRVDMSAGWATPPGYPTGIKQKILASDLDESKKYPSCSPHERSEMRGDLAPRQGSRMSLRSSGLPARRGTTMLAPEDKLKFSPKPYLSATARFVSGGDTPRDFLERCLADLATLEPRIGAFVHLDLDAARAS